MRRRWLCLVAGLWAAGCASGPERARRADALPPGCAVEVFREGAPTRPVQSLGEVTSRCTGDAMNDTPGCTRALQDQACALGATVVWGVSSSQTEDALVMRAYAGRYR